MPIQLSMPNPQRMRNVAAAISTALVLVPRLSAARSFFIPASSSVLTKKMPMIDSTTPTAAIIDGASTAFICIPSTADVANAEAPNAIVARILPAYDS